MWGTLINMRLPTFELIRHGNSVSKIVNHISAGNAAAGLATNCFCLIKESDSFGALGFFYALGKCALGVDCWNNVGMRFESL